jgi:hypothetical protein
MASYDARSAFILAQTHTHTRTYIDMRLFMRDIHADMHINIHTYPNTHIPTYTHTHTCVTSTVSSLYLHMETLHIKKLNRYTIKITTTTLMKTDSKEKTKSM